MRRALARAPRCSLANVTTGESIECMFNPAQLTEKVQVGYNRLAVPGLSHQVLQYAGTGNRRFEGVEFYLDRFFASEDPQAPDILEFRSFIRALTVPSEAAQTVLSTAPPRVLVLWPGVLSVEAVVTDAEFQFRQFGVDGQVLVYAALLSFEEVLDQRVTSEQLRRGGR